MKNKMSVHVCLRLNDHPDKWQDIEYTPDDRFYGFAAKLKEAAEAYVRKCGIHSSRKDPVTVSVRWQTYKPVNGSLQPSNREQLCEVMPPLAPMTEEEFAEEQAALLKDIPEAFHSWASVTAYEDGHSAGMEEVICLLRNLVSGIKPAIAAYRAELTKHGTT